MVEVLLLSLLMCMLLEACDGAFEKIWCWVTERSHWLSLRQRYQKIIAFFFFFFLTSMFYFLFLLNSKSFFFLNYKRLRWPLMVRLIKSVPYPSLLAHVEYHSSVMTVYSFDLSYFGM